MSSRFARYAVLAGNPALQALWSARVVSKLGDWAARVALITLVFTSTGSALWAGVTTAACYAPFLGPGQLLATYADRLPHRTVLIVSDLVRLPIFLALALVPMPPAAMVVLAFVAAFGDVPSGAAYQAAIPLVAKERYSEAMVMFATTAQVTILLGYAGGGVLVTLIGSRGVLLVNAVTFLVAALLVLRVPSTRSGGTVTRARTHLRESVRIVTADRLVAVTLAVVAVSCLGQMGIESLTVVYSHHLGFGTGVGAGLLYTVMPLAAIATGFFLPTWTDPLRLVRLVVGLNVALCALSITVFLVAGTTPVGHPRPGRPGRAGHDDHPPVRDRGGTHPDEPPGHGVRVLPGMLHGDAAGRCTAHRGAHPARRDRGGLRARLRTDGAGRRAVLAAADPAAGPGRGSRRRGGPGRSGLSSRSAEGPDRGVESTPVVAAHHDLDDLDAARGVGERVTQLLQGVDPPVGRARRGAQARHVDVVRRPEEPVVRRGVLRRPLLQRREHRARRRR